ncbi:PTS fructose transporter subunit IIA [Streptomyces mashuensis]|uniref:PTS sugar transporter subunit IIA domain-containing protein n=1 Tax=Streptomyces mashuensis TaxID=33904 RepID=UPI00227D7A47|nr:PTS fructose transporter subunit IIA [Streptomyces mashuensis]
MCATAPVAPEEEPAPAEAAPAAAPGPVGLVLVSHSREVAGATAALARALVGSGEPAPLECAGGLPGGGVGTDAGLVRRALAAADRGSGVVALCDMGSAVLTVKTLLAEAEAPAGHVRIADAPFVEGAVAAAVTASAGGDLAAVLAAAEDARDYRKL